MSKIVVPSLGESVSEATISRWLKQVGDTAKADEPIVELETDKVTLEVNAPGDGVISLISAKEGDTVEVGAVLGEFEVGKAANDPDANKSSTKKAKSPAKGTGKLENIIVPTLGESVAEATIGKWLKQPGDDVAIDEALVELETDKATMEVNAHAAGVIKDISAKEGESVEIGAVLGHIEVGAKSVAPQPSDPVPDKQTAQPASALQPMSKVDKSALLSPAVRKMITDHNLDAADISVKIGGRGKDGRLTKEDVQAYLDKGLSKSAAASVPNSSNPNNRAAREERVKMTRLRQNIAKRLKEAQNTAAMLTTFNEVDMGAVMKLRAQYKEGFEKKHGVKLGFMSFFVKAAVNALKDFPEVNSEIDGDEIVYKNYYDISVAVSTPQGLVVPVVRECDEKSMAQIEKDIIDLGTRAREGKLSIQEMMGGTFTITNGGIFGSLMSTPIINPPQTAIMGMHKIQQRPMVMPDGSIEARPMMYLAMSYDHRIIDGKEAVSFLVAIKNAIEDPQRLILDI